MSHSFGLWAYSLKPITYQKLIDRGWRRSGQYLYRPNLRRSCCKSYTIRLNARQFKPDKKHRQALNKFNRFVLGQDHLAVKERQNATFDLASTLTKVDGEVKFQAVFTSPVCTKEKFDLYKKYQIAVHHDEPASLKRSGFERFLCDSPIHNMPLPGNGAATKDFILDNGTTLQYGSIHQLYRMDGKLIAMAVLDILPNCVSSVYFMYDPDYAHLSLGRVSACREAALAHALARPRTIATAQRTATELVAPAHVTIPQASHQVEDSDGWYYMGFYIPTCPKMAYKGEYSPSWLLDPGVSVDSAIWHSLPQYTSVWAQREKEKGDRETDAVKSRHASIDWLVSFSQPKLESTQAELAIDEDRMSDPATLWASDMPGMIPPTASMPPDIKVLDSGYVRYLDNELLSENPDLLAQLKAIRAVCGNDILKEMIIAI